MDPMKVSALSKRDDLHIEVSPAVQSVRIYHRDESHDKVPTFSVNRLGIVAYGRNYAIGLTWAELDELKAMLK